MAAAISNILISALMHSVNGFTQTPAGLDFKREHLSHLARRPEIKRVSLLKHPQERRKNQEETLTQAPGPISNVHSGPFFSSLDYIVVVSPFGASSLLSMSWFALVSYCLTKQLFSTGEEPAGWPTFSDNHFHETDNVALNSFS